MIESNKISIPLRYNIRQNIETGSFILKLYYYSNKNKRFDGNRVVIVIYDIIGTFVYLYCTGFNPRILFVFLIVNP